VSHTERSPLPGTFNPKPSPDAEPYASEGDAVEAGDVVGLVEIMKQFHDVKADAAGVIEAFLVENESPIDAGQDVLRLRD
jgi:biotin carboxyl carrier protein